MEISRRKFLKLGAAAGGTAAFAVATPARAQEAKEPDSDWFSMLNDETRCIGCKSCQVACKRSNHLAPESTLDDKRQTGHLLYDSPRELDANTFTVIELARTKQGQSSFVKRQCMHCADPGCASACIVGAMKKQPDGVVTYDSGRCMGCRYCMVACPYGVPQFQWDRALPSVRKCTMCYEARLKKGRPTACSSACPAGAITFGKRGDMLALARRRLAEEPERYEPQIYGEHEVGGTGVLYLTRKHVSFAALGLPAFGDKPVSSLTESIQHRVFQYFIPPIAVYSLLGGIMAFNHRRHKKAGKEGGDDEL